MEFKVNKSNLNKLHVNLGFLGAFIHLDLPQQCL
jgi:hypothetical protein